MPSMKLSTCLSNLDITDATIFEECDGIGEEFKVIKRIWARKVLKDHPDKGGDPNTFRATHAAFEVLRDLYNGNRIRGGTFAIHVAAFEGGDRDDDDWDADDDDFDLDDLYAKYANGSTSVPSYEYFAAAAAEEVPGYRVEPARSGRSTCGRCKEKIPKDEIRVGSMDKVSGTYGRWNRLGCWRVPVKVQNGLTNPADEQVSLRDLLSMEEVLLTGVGALSHGDKLLFVRHCVDSENWAGNGKRKRMQIMGDTGIAEQGPSKSSKATSSSESTSAAAEARGRSSAPGSNPASGDIAPGTFAVLVPGVDGALDDDRLLRGKTFVLTGSFPEAGGGDAGAVGLENVKAMIRSFGGKVISRFSKNTNFLLVGKDPIAGKFKDARKRSVVIICLRRLQGLLLGRIPFEACAKLPPLASDMFEGSAYRAAGANAAYRPDAPVQPDAGASSARKEWAGSVKPPEAKMPPAPASATSAAEAEMPSGFASAAKASGAKIPAASRAAPAGGAAGKSVGASTLAVVAHANPQEGRTSSSSLAQRKKAKFAIPVPGVNGAVAGVLDGKKVVTTGIFPELGGGVGLSLGKDRARSMIESFGGRVTSAVSGKTDLLLVGKEPGRSKVSNADARGLPMIDLLSMQRLLMGQMSLEGVANEPPPRITSFSAGYPGQQYIAY